MNTRTLRGDHPFSMNETIAPHIHALLEPFATWTGYYGLPATIRYTLNIPQNPKILPSLLLRLFSQTPPISIDPNIGLGNIGRDELLIEHALRFWERVANVRFIRDDVNYQLPIYKYMASDPLSKTAGYGFYPSNKSQYIHLGIGIERNYFSLNSHSNIFSPQFEVVLHEIGHAAMGFKHPFEGGFSLNETEQLLTSFSVMNYKKERSNGASIFSITPMPADIEAAQFVFGPNLQTGNGNDVFLLKDFVPEKLLSYKTIACIWDANGTDTFSTQGVIGPVQIDINPGARSALPTGYVVIANHVKIENVIVGEGKGSITLNEDNNLIDLRAAKEPIEILFDPRKWGNDIFFGFDPKRDSLISLNSKLKLNFIPGEADHSTLNFMPGIECHATTLGNKEIIYCVDLLGTYDKNNSITFATIQSERVIKPEQTFQFQDKVKLDQQTTSQFLDIFTEFPTLFLNDLSLAMVKGTLFGFIFSWTEDLLKSYGCSDKQIKIASVVIPMLLSIYTGTLTATSVTMLTSSTVALLTGTIFSLCGFSKNTTVTMATIFSAVSTTTQSFTPLGLTRGFFSATGSLGTCWASMWMYKHFIGKNSQESKTITNRAKP